MKPPLEKPLSAPGQHEIDDPDAEIVTAETDPVPSEAQKEIGNNTAEVRSASADILAENEATPRRPWMEERLHEWLEKEVGITDPEKIADWKQRFDFSNEELIIHTGNLILRGPVITELPTGTQGLMIRNGNLILEGVAIRKLPPVIMKGGVSHVNLAHSAITEISDGTCFGNGLIFLEGTAIKKLPEKMSLISVENTCFCLDSEQAELIEECRKRRLRYRIQQGGKVVYDSKIESLKRAPPQTGLIRSKRERYREMG